MGHMAEKIKEVYYFLHNHASWKCLKIVAFFLLNSKIECLLILQAHQGTTDKQYTLVAWFTDSPKTKIS